MGTLVGHWIGNAASGTQTGTCIKCWFHKQKFALQCHNTGSDVENFLCYYCVFDQTWCLAKAVAPKISISLSLGLYPMASFMSLLYCTVTPLHFPFAPQCEYYERVQFSELTGLWLSWHFYTRFGSTSTCQSFFTPWLFIYFMISVCENLEV